jgi:AmmeMemoRadiSam system radical SAM enzyme
VVGFSSAFLVGSGMTRVVDNPPQVPRLPDGAVPGGWWHDDPAEAGRIVCDLCPRACALRPGDRAFCFVRENRDGQMVLTTYGHSTGFCIDPVEKKPLNHFYPGTSILSFGTAGCNLGCKFCQNWSISKSREIELLSESASPQAIAQAALELGCKSVAFTYNDPVIWAEYAIDTARACREVGVKAVAVTAGYITPQARGAFYEYMDAANVDLKGFTEEFYYKLTLAHLQPVLDTLVWLQRETNVWFEITNLLIPQANDSSDELKRMCDWIFDHLGPEVPVHFTAFHPDFRLRDRCGTPAETLFAAHDIATQRGLRYVYVGNLSDRDRQTTHCPQCRESLIVRASYEILRYAIRDGRCGKCGAAIAGRFDNEAGDWGSRRQGVRIAEFERAANLPEKPLVQLGHAYSIRQTAPIQTGATSPTPDE